MKRREKIKYHFFNETFSLNMGIDTFMNLSNIRRMTLPLFNTGGVTRGVRYNPLNKS